MIDFVHLTNSTESLPTALATKDNVPFGILEVGRRYGFRRWFYHISHTNRLKLYLLSLRVPCPFTGRARTMLFCNEQEG